jgi:hypothetical protein
MHRRIWHPIGNFFLHLLLLLSYGVLHPYLYVVCDVIIILWQGGEQLHQNCTQSQGTGWH